MVWKCLGEPSKKKMLSRHVCLFLLADIKMDDLDHNTDLGETLEVVRGKMKAILK